MIASGLSKLLFLKQGETKKGLTLAFFYFAAGVYAVVVESVAYAVFNIRFGVRYLPYIFLIVPYINMAASLFMMRKMTAGNKRRTFRYIILVVFIIHILGFILLKGVFVAKIFYAVFFILMFTVLENLILMRTCLLQSVLDIESAKRLVPIAASGFAIGAILTGYVLSRLKGFIPTEMIYLGVTLFLFLMVYLGDTLYKKYQMIDEISTHSEKISYFDGARFLTKNSFYLMVTLLVAILFITSNVNSYIFNSLITNVFRSEGKITAVLGTLMAFQFVLSLIIDLFLFNRFVRKIGTLKMMKFVLINGIIGMVLLIFADKIFFLAILSRAILTILVINLGDLLLDLMYQPLPQRYRDKVITLIYFIFSWVGLTFGGLFSIIQAKGLINTYYLALVPIFLLILAFIVWEKSKSSFITAIKQNVSLSAEQIDLTLLFGDQGLKEHLPYLTEKVKSGTTTEKRFVLEFIERISFEEKESLLEQVFKSGTLTIKIKILEMVFSGSLSDRVIRNSIGEMDLDLIQYMIRSIFLQSDGFKNATIIKLIGDKSSHFNYDQFSCSTQLMYKYLVESKNDCYELLLIEYISSQRSDDYQMALRIMKSYLQTQSVINQKYLKLLIENIKGDTALLKDAVELGAQYDQNVEFYYLKTIFSTDCSYEIMEQVCTSYKIETIKRVLTERQQLIPKTMILYAARKDNPQAVKDYYPYYRGVLDELKSLLQEEQKILKLEHQGKELLLQELKPIIAVVSGVLIDYLFLYYKNPLIHDLNQHLMYPSRKLLVLETVKNSLPLKASDELLQVLNINADTPCEKSGLNYKSLTIGDLDSILMKTYCYMGGETMTDQFCNDIEQMILLKAVPMFKELSMESLYQLLKITHFKTFRTGDTVIRKGEVGDTFYVVQSGEVGVYVKEDRDCIAKISCGGIFGELGIIDKDIRTATVKALQDTTVLEFDGDDFIGILKKNNTVAFSVIKTLSQRLRNMLNH
jgi:hypothetical protein